MSERQLGDLAFLRSEVEPIQRDRFDELIVCLDRFCDEYLNDEYKMMAREMATALTGEYSPLMRGKMHVWAAGLIFVLGEVNFLGDPDFEPHMSQKDIADALGVSRSTISAKAKIIREDLDVMPFDPIWCLDSMLEHNPIAWMVTVDDFLMDARTLPRDVQAELADNGLIPYCWEDKHGPYRTEPIFDLDEEAELDEVVQKPPVQKTSDANMILPLFPND